MIKKVFTLSLATVLLLSTGLSVHAAQENDNNPINGAIIEKVNIKKTFEEGSLNLPNAKKKSLELVTTNVSLQDGHLLIQGSVNNSNTSENTQFTLNGKLYNSYTQNEGYANYVADLTDEQNNYEVLYFLIKNDSKNLKYVLNKDLTDEKIFILYLKDKYGNVLAFEDSLDKLGIDVSNLSLNETASAKNDYLWFTQILTPTEEGKIENPISDIGIKSVHSSSSTTSIVYKDWTYGGDSYRESAWATVNASIGDVPRYGSAAAQTTLTLVEYVYRNSTLFSRDSNYQLQYAGSVAVRDMYGKIAVGNNTTVQNFFWDGAYWEWSNFQTSLSIRLATGLSAWNTSANVGLTITAPEYKQRGSSNLKTLYPSGGNFPKLAVTHIEKSKNLYLDNNDDYLTMAANIATADSSQTTNVSTSAKFGWTFDIFYYSEFTPKDSRTDFGPTINYTSNAQ